jgi:hypothetical protein
MVVINKDIDSNLIAVTLREYQSTETDIFLFVFINGFTNEKVRINLTDVSHNKDRSNMFCVPGDHFSRTGFYTYAVFENPDEAESEEGLRCVETGKAKVIKNISPTKAYSFDVKTRNVYGE